MQRAHEGKVSFVWHHGVDEILGDNSGVNALRLRSAQNGATREVAFR